MIQIIVSSPLLRTAFLLILFLVVSGVALLVVRQFSDRRRVIERLDEKVALAGPSSGESLRGNSVQGAWARMAKTIESSGLSLMDSNPVGLRRKLIAAGFRSEQAPKVFTLARLILIFLLPLAIVMPQFFSDDPPSLFTLYIEGAALALLGLFLPNLFVTAKADRRRQEILNGFPDCLDLMLVCVEAGMGLEAALDRVGREMVESHQLVAEMLSQTTLELRAGASREDALRGMADRVDVDEIRAFSTLLIQSDKLGSSIATTLRIYASEMREKRRMRAEEKAHRLPVLISIPLVACMLPVMIGVLMLPAIIRVIRELVPAMAGGG